MVKLVVNEGKCLANHNTIKIVESPAVVS